MSRIPSFRYDATAPASRCVPVTPSDSVLLPQIARSLYVGSGGNVVLIDGAGNQVTFTNVPGGSVLPVYAAGVRATGTSASGIVALL